MKKLICIGQSIFLPFQKHNTLKLSRAYNKEFSYMLLLLVLRFVYSSMMQAKKFSNSSNSINQKRIQNTIKYLRWNILQSFS